MIIKKKIKLVLLAIGLGMTGVASANSIYFIKKGAPDINTDCGFIDGFKTVSNQEQKDVVNQIINDELKNYVLNFYAAKKQAFEKAIVNPTIENVAESLLYQNIELKALAELKKDVVNAYNVAQEIVLDQSLTAKKKMIIHQSNYPIVAAVAKVLRDSASDQIKQPNINDDGIYKGIADNSCNDSSGCNEIISKSQDIYRSLAIRGSVGDFATNKQILAGAPYAFNLGMLENEPVKYQALKDTKTFAYQQAQLAILTDIDYQLRKRNQQEQEQKQRKGGNDV
ncbi:hypothetical protein [Cysteiniphilum halobium]|uniref:hypothetical protein n=1 Tax=Cysteiniphilum halobium TaxID=2219059 RepID=UPI000E648F96|nr:hypothetical protein [Cysteiniphilum halobium]